MSKQLTFLVLLAVVDLVIPIVPMTALLLIVCLFNERLRNELINTITPTQKKRKRK